MATWGTYPDFTKGDVLFYCPKKLPGFIMSVSVEELSILAFQESELEEGRNSLNRQAERKSRIN